MNKAYEESFDFSEKCLYKAHDGQRMQGGMARYGGGDTKILNAMSQNKPKELKIDEVRDTCGGN